MSEWPLDDRTGPVNGRRVVEFASGSAIVQLKHGEEGLYWTAGNLEEKCYSVRVEKLRR